MAALALGVTCIASLAACEFLTEETPVLLDMALNADGSGYCVTGIGQETAEDILLPSTYQGKPVTEIGESAFARSTAIKSIEIPSSVKKVGKTAFLQCTALERVQIMSGVEELGEKAFGSCTALKEVSIADSVVSYGESVFYECSALERTEKDGGYYIGNGSNPYTVLMQVNTDVTSYTIENGCCYLYDKSFLGCTALESIYMPDSVVQIGYKAFSNCTSLYGPILSNNVHTIGRYAFENCTGLQVITLGAKIKLIDRFAFYSCKLSCVEYKGTKEDRAKIEINVGYNSKLNINDAANGAKWVYLEE